MKRHNLPLDLLASKGGSRASGGTCVRCDKLHVHHAGHGSTLISAVVLPLGEIGYNKRHTLYHTSPSRLPPLHPALWKRGGKNLKAVTAENGELFHFFQEEKNREKDCHIPASRGFRPSEIHLPRGTNPGDSG